MSFKIQLRDARNSDIRNVSGVCQSSEQFAEQVNAVTRRLMKRGGWFGTEVLVQFCIYGAEIVFPRHIATVIGSRFREAEMKLNNNWYAIVGSHQDDVPFADTVRMRDDGTACTFRPVTGNEGKQIAYHVVKREDVGKKITLYGFYYGGQPLQEYVGGKWQMGLTITSIAAGGTPGAGGTILPAMTPAVKADKTDLITKITAITREATQGMCYLYEYGPDANGTNALNMLGSYEPNETTPQYRRSRIINIDSMNSTEDIYGRKVRWMECLVKLEFIPAINDNDFLLVDDIDALKFAIQAYRKEEAGEDAAAEVCMSKAIRELNMNDRVKSPGRQVSVKVRVTGSNASILNPI